MRVHGVEAIRILHPVLAKGGAGGRVIHVDMVEPHVRPVHDVDGPQWRILHINYDFDKLRPLPGAVGPAYSARQKRH